MAPPQEKIAGTLKILVADDDLAIRERLRRALVSKGHEVVPAEDGEAALAKAQEGRFQLAILDLVMPKKGGIETLEALKNLDPGIEVVIVTGYASQASATEAIQRGAYAYLIKPFDMLELEALLPSVFEKVGLKALVGLLEATRSVFADVKLDDLLLDLMALACKILAADEATLIMRTEDSKLRIAASSSPSIQTLKGSEVNIEDSVAGRVARWKTGVAIEGPLHSDPRFADLPSHRSVRHSLVYPIMLKDDLEGILCANRRENKERFQPQDLRHAAIFCSHVAQAIENAKLYEKLQAARNEALKANALKDEFLYITTHDLKVPLSIIQGYTERLLKLDGLTHGGRVPEGASGSPLAGGADAKARSELASRILHNVDSMISLIRQILRKGQLESGEFKLDRRPVAVSELAGDCLRDLELLARAKSIRLVKEDRLPPAHQGNIDAEALTEIIENLVANAVKFCQAGDTVTVTIDRADGRLVLKVSDTGPGIPEDDQKHLFQRFHRGKGAQAEGSGYGLAIVKTLAEIHGGGVKLESSSGKGSVFTVVLAEA
ncbi:MAG: response regulator [Elusimicrobia bacterium]|nr:response regulator [Elusimicrobiota bacterium]